MFVNGQKIKNKKLLKLNKININFIMLYKEKNLLKKKLGKRKYLCYIDGILLEKKDKMN